MNRPQPRQSTLAGTSPVAPPTVEPKPFTSRPTPPQTTATTDTPAPKQAARPATQFTVPEEAPQTAKKPPPAKVSIYMDQADADRLRAVVRFTGPMEDTSRTLSDFAAAAIKDRMDLMENRYNDGQPWPHTPAGRLATGRSPR